MEQILLNVENKNILPSLKRNRLGYCYNYTGKINVIVRSADFYFISEKVICVNLDHSSCCTIGTQFIFVKYAK